MSISTLLLVLAVLPALGALACVVLPHRPAAITTFVVGLICLAAVIRLVPAVGDGTVSVGFLRVDALSVVFLLPTGFLYAATAAFAIGYLGDEARHAARADAVEQRVFGRYSRLFFVGFNAFAWSMLCAPMGDGLALLWIAVEVTTVVSALLVALDNTEGATEAAWKYVLIASCGLGVALLATIVMYYAGAQSLGQSYDLALDPLIAHAAQLPATPVRLAFVLAVVGFGTKVGLVPLHTWLPDAHAEAPTPVSALLSGSLLAVSFYAILRYYQVAHVALGPAFPQRVLLVFGIASLLLAALSLLRQSDVKRLLAYSSVEHMGILAIGVSFGVRLALVGVLLHVLAHAAAKGNAFMGSGVIVRVFQTKSLDRIRGVMDRLPWSGPIFLASVLALCALPPFGLFRSEFDIVAGGVGAGRTTPAAILIVLVTVAFLGLVGAVGRMVLTRPAEPSGASGEPAGESAPQLVLAGAVAGDRSDQGPASAAGAPGDRRTPPRHARGGSPGSTGEGAGQDRSPRGEDHPGREPSYWMVAPTLAGLAVLLVLGIHPPGDLAAVLQTAADQLTGAVAR
ncbi:MAG: proton-conducting transporter membrane subunit [Nocardioides sp.]|uniref:proton-conducting transporter transmembrane domain-containing protein n=1 Tax=Nocardioides sp. TaxID=35761 RepID=UPI0039E5F677